MRKSFDKTPIPAHKSSPDVTLSKRAKNITLENIPKKGVRTLEVRGRSVPEKKKITQEQREKLQVRDLIEGKYKKERTNVLKNEKWGDRFERLVDFLNNTQAGRVIKQSAEALIGGSLLVGGALLTGPLALLFAPALSLAGTSFLSGTAIRSALLAGKEWKRMGKLEKAKGDFIKLEASLNTRVIALREKLKQGKKTGEYTESQFRKDVLKYVQERNLAEKNLSQASCDLRGIQKRNAIITSVGRVVATGGLAALGGIEVAGLHLGGISFGMQDFDMNGIAHQTILGQGGMIGYVKSAAERIIQGHLTSSIGGGVSLPPQAFAGLASALYGGALLFAGDIASKIGKAASEKETKQFARIIEKNAKLIAWKKAAQREKDRAMRKKEIKILEGGKKSPWKKTEIGSTLKENEKETEKVSEKAPFEKELFKNELRSADALRGFLAHSAGFANSNQEFGPKEFWDRFDAWMKNAPNDQKQDFRKKIDEIDTLFLEYARDEKLPLQYDDRSRVLDTLKFILDGQKSKEEPSDQLGIKENLKRNDTDKKITELKKLYQPLDKNEFIDLKTTQDVYRRALEHLGIRLKDEYVAKNPSAYEHALMQWLNRAPQEDVARFSAQFYPQTSDAFDEFIRDKKPEEFRDQQKFFDDITNYFVEKPPLSSAV